MNLENMTSVIYVLNITLKLSANCSNIIYVFLYQNLNANFITDLASIPKNLCISILEFKQETIK